MKLQEIKYDKELSAFNEEKLIMSDSLITKLTLENYGWMSYRFETFFPTKEQGDLNIKVEYYGFINCTAVITQDKKKEITIQFPTSVFVEFIKDFLTKHMAQWESEFAFCGEEEAVEFFNNILRNANSYAEKEGIRD